MGLQTSPNHLWLIDPTQTTGDAASFAPLQIQSDSQSGPMRLMYLLALYIQHHRYTIMRTQRVFKEQFMPYIEDTRHRPTMRLSDISKVHLLG